MQANVRAFEQAVGWRAQDTLLTAYGQAELQTQLQAQQQAQLQAQQLAQLQAQHQAQQQAQQHSPQQAEQNSQQQGQQEARQKSQRQTWLSDRHAVPFAPELPDADGRYPNLVVEFQPVDLTEDDPPGPDEPILTTTWSECHDFQAMEALLHKIYCSDKTQSNIHYVTATRRKDSWLSLDRVSDEKQLQVYARLSIIQKRSLQIAAFYVPPGE
ncbi:hypothetical protein KC333_g5515 [Hortaea werneckii]|nr:hypothetical protein KC333_g5515 [Hortaea werneckii]KAI7318723.1 hypothetical protein KC326_g3457 [Hortaea werneckii]